MRKTILTAALVAALTCTTLPLAAATPSEFYSSLLRRGVAAFDAGRYDEAARHLKYAAFGYVDSIEPYQLAQVYLALAYERLEEPELAREAVRRLMAAERIERRYAKVSVPPAVRTAFEKIAARVLTAPELAALRGTGQLPAPLPVQSSVRTTTTGTPAKPVQQPPASTATTATTTPVTKPVSPPAMPPATQPATQPATVERVDVEVIKPAQTQQPAATQAATPRPVQTQTQTQTQPAQTQPAQTQAVPPRPVQTQPAPAQTTAPRGTNNHTTTTTTTTPPRPAAAVPAPARPTYSASDIATRFANAERALTASNLTEARRIYRELLASANSAGHDTAVRIAEGFYRARDFAGALAAFERGGALRRGEEPYRYYVAVALYETGQYDRAKRELAGALPYIEVTPDVERYRLKIQSAIQ